MRGLTVDEIEVVVGGDITWGDVGSAIGGAIGGLVGGAAGGGVGAAAGGAIGALVGKAIGEYAGCESTRNACNTPAPAIPVVYLN